MKISIFEEIDDGVNHTVTKRHDGGYFEERPVPVGVVSEIEHEIVDLADGVTHDVQTLMIRNVSMVFFLASWNLSDCESPVIVTALLPSVTSLGSL